MKLITILILSITLCYSLQAFLSEKNENENEMTHSLKSMKPAKGKPANKTKTKSGKSSNKNATGTNVLPGKAKSTNAVGKIGPAHFSISKPPYKVTRCDQVLLIPAKQVNYRDYSKKKDVFLTMSAYVINSFSKKDPSKLENSIYMDKSIKIPKILQGAPGCVDFMSLTTRISACLKDDATAQQIINAYMDFWKCRKSEFKQDIACSMNQTENIALDISPYYKDKGVPGA